MSETIPKSPESSPIAMARGETEETGQYYDAESKNAGWDSPERVQRLVEPYVGEDSLVLDIGIGTGQAVEGYTEKGAMVVGVDINRAMLDRAQAVVGEHGVMRQGSVNDTLPIADLEGEVDVAQAVGVLEFAHDLSSAIDQVAPALREDGVFVFTIEAKAEDDDSGAVATDYPEAGVTVYKHSVAEVQSLLDEKGFTVLHDESYGGYVRDEAARDTVPYHVFLARK